MTGVTNQPPVATNASATIAENAPATAINVLSGCSDPDGDTLTVTSVTTASHGTASLSGGVVYYKPNTGYLGTDSFTYTISDGYGGTATADVNITVEYFGPAAPTNTTPAGGATGVVLAPTLTASSFTELGSATQLASQWVLTLTSTGATVWNSNTDTSATDSVTVPQGLLTYNTQYSWSVRYEDTSDIWGPYSTATSFTTSANVAPNTPTNSLPASGVTGVIVAPTLTASPFSDSIDDTQEGSEWVITLTSGGTTVWDSGVYGPAANTVVVPLGNLTYGTQYSWQVRYEDSGGLWSSYSTATSFTTSANLPPNTPTNSSPNNHATAVSLTPPLQASSFSDSDGDAQAASEWVVTQNSTVVWDSGTDTSDTNTTTVPSGKLAYDTGYSWKVRYEDSGGLWSSYSTATTFTTVTQPVTPVNSSPANGASGVYLQPVLTASAFSDPTATQTASEWVVTQVSNSTVVWDSGTDTTATDSATVLSGKLTYNTAYSWKVRYENNSGIWSAYSTATTFTTTTNLQPNTPTNTTPANGATLVPLAATLTASAFSDQDEDTQAASQWVVTTVSTDTVAWNSGTDTSDTSSTTVPLGKLDYSTEYSWKVRYEDSGGLWSNYSSPTTFYTVNLPPPVPTNVAPVAGALFVSTTPTLQGSAWNDPGASQGGSEWIITPVSGTTPVWDSGMVTTDATSATVPSGVLANNTAYSWTVEYEDSNDQVSGYSTPTTFTTWSASATKLAFVQQPGNAVAGGALTQAPEVVVEDASGHTVTSVAVTIALAAGSSATLSGTTTVVAGNGIAVFSNLSLTKAGSYTLVATDGSLTQAKSSAFTVTPDTSSLHLGLVQQPAATVAGQTLLPTPVVAVEDEYGNIVTTSSAKISLAWTAAPSDPTIFGSSTVSTTGGKATFANIALPKADTYTVSATASGFQSTTLFTQTVNLATSAVSSCSVASSYTYGQAATISATLTSNAPTTVPFSGTATVVDQSDNVLGSVSVAANGAIKFALTGLAAGTRTCTIQYAGDTNHTTAASAPFTLKIVAAPLTITANNQTKVYGSPNPTLTATYAGLVNGDVPASVPVIIGTVAATSGAGSYAITVSGASDPNYTVRYVSGTLTISKAPLTITANNQSKTYGNANPALAATYSGLVNGDTSASVPATLSTTATTTSKVGTYAITVSAASSNYKITCAGWHPDGSTRDPRRARRRGRHARLVLRSGPHHLDRGHGRDGL